MYLNPKIGRKRAQSNKKIFLCFSNQIVYVFVAIAIAIFR